MNKAMMAALTIALLWPATLSAHRLDEYLQATRVSLGRAELCLEIDLTPGANVATSIITLIDRDGDLTISPEEAAIYGRQVLGDVTVTLDGHPLALTLTRIEAPSIGEFRDGLGQMQLRATAPAGPAVSARRELFVRNAHLPESSVYLVNALLPEDRGIEVVKQTRDPRQSSSTIEYRVESGGTAQVSWALLGVASLAGLIVFRRRSMPPTAAPAAI